MILFFLLEGLLAFISFVFVIMFIALFQSPQKQKSDESTTKILPLAQTMPLKPNSASSLEKKPVVGAVDSARPDRQTTEVGFALVYTPATKPTKLVSFPYETDDTKQGKSEFKSNLDRWRARKASLDSKRDDLGSE